MAKPKPPARPQLRAGDVVVLRQSGEHVEGEIIAIVADGRYKVRWSDSAWPTGDRIATVTIDEIHKKT